MGRLVDDARFGVKVPKAANVGLTFNAIEWNAVELEVFSNAESRCSGPNNAKFISKIRHWLRPCTAIAYLDNPATNPREDELETS